MVFVSSGFQASSGIEITYTFGQNNEQINLLFRVFGEPDPLNGRRHFGENELNTALRHVEQNFKEANISWYFTDGDGSIYEIAQRFIPAGGGSSNGVNAVIVTSIVGPDGVLLNEHELEEFGFLRWDPVLIADGGLQSRDECFLAGTPISLWDGTTKPIEAVRPEDWVVSYDREGNLVPGRVTRIFRNRAPHIIDLFGLMLTPGHVTLCGDGPLAGRHVPVIDILRTDGAVVRQDGSKVRAATGVPLGQANDRLIWAVAGMRAGTGATRVTDKARIRLGTRVITPDGEDVCIADQIARAGGRITDDGMIQTRIGGPKMPFHWPYAERLPRPEDYVLSRSGLTLAAIYQASDWEGAGSLLTVPEPASPGSAVQRRPRPADHGK